MRFWDTSGLVPLVIEQPASRAARESLLEDSEMAVWWGSTVECWSAFARLRREGRMTADEEEGARSLMDTVRRTWLEILPGEELRTQAGRLLRLHPLRAADAFQLAAALIWAGNPPSGDIVLFDQRLSEAARLEGLTPRP